MPIAYISHPDCLKHNVGEFHPEHPERLTAIYDYLLHSGLELALQLHDAENVSQENLELAHTKSYIKNIFTKSPDEGLCQLDSDTLMMPHTLKACLRAAGAVVQGVDLVMKGEVKSAFCAVRPPGHHAEKDKAMGFCYFNNISVGTAYAIKKYNLSRVAIVDFDVHHGNGTENIFKDDHRVLFCSSFQHPFYPHSGADTINDKIVNVPLSAGTKGAAFREQIELQWLPALEEFKPELIMISAGFDAHVADDMGQLSLNEKDYEWITNKIKEIADKYAQSRIVSSLEGGYEIGSLARSVAAHIDALLGFR